MFPLEIWSLIIFWIVKVIGACYLMWLRFKVLRSRNLINFKPRRCCAEKLQAAGHNIIGLARNEATAKMKPFMKVCLF